MPAQRRHLFRLSVADGATPVALQDPRTRAWAIVGALSVTETVSWGILDDAFAVFLVPMQRELGFSAAQLTGAFSAGLLVSGGAGIVVGRYLDHHGPRGWMTAGSCAGAALVLAWSRIEGLAAFYALWVALGSSWPRCSTNPPSPCPPSSSRTPRSAGGR